MRSAEWPRPLRGLTLIDGDAAWAGWPLAEPTAVTRNRIPVTGQTRAGVVLFRAQAGQGVNLAANEFSALPSFGAQNASQA
jgi:hypothetical protein